MPEKWAKSPIPCTPKAWTCTYKSIEGFFIWKVGFVFLTYDNLLCIQYYLFFYNSVHIILIRFIVTICAMISNLNIWFLKHDILSQVPSDSFSWCSRWSVGYDEEPHDGTYFSALIYATANQLFVLIKYVKST